MTVYTVIMQVSRSTGAAFTTKQLTLRISKTAAALVATQKSRGLIENLTANAKIRRTYNESEYVESANLIAEMTYTVYAGNVAVGKFHVVKVS